MYTKILVAYDGSDYAKRALDSAIDVAKGMPGCTIQVATVVNVQNVIFSESFTENNEYKAEFDKLVEKLREHGWEILGQAARHLEEKYMQYETFMLEGQSTAETLISFAQEQGCDLIVMGSRGLSGFEEYLGSVSNAVMHHSDIPVLIER